MSKKKLSVEEKANRLDAIVATAKARLRELRQVFTTAELASMPEVFTLKDVLKEAGACAKIN